jgi:amphi-Trp domain-containing protein
MTEDLDIEVSHEVSTFVAELRRLADALEQGTDYMIEIDGDEITIPADALLSIAHEREDGEVELEFQITWSEASDDEEDGDDEDEDDADADQDKDKEDAA